jgi:hypothetical protein
MIPYRWLYLSSVFMGRIVPTLLVIGCCLYVAEGKENADTGTAYPTKKSIRNSADHDIGKVLRDQEILFIKPP